MKEALSARARFSLCKAIARTANGMLRRTAPFDGSSAASVPLRSTPLPLDRALRLSAAALVAWFALTMLAQSRSATIETVFFNRDALWLLVFAVLLVALSVLPQKSVVLTRSFAALSRTRWSETMLALVVMAVSLAGARVVFHGYAFTQDETMARFDAAILRHGQLLARIPQEWQPYAGALMPRFVLPVADHAAWVSSYLPVNAAIRALLEAVPGLDLASPLLAGISIVAVAGIARRLWPDRPDAALVAALLLATSIQVLFTAFTPFAMTAHLALDLVWLWLFLRKDAVGHAGAIAIAVLACGLHQVVFHPLFAMPFVLQLWLSRRWRIAALYTLAYAAIGLFWVLYWQLMLGSYGLHGSGVAQHGIAPFVNQVVGLVRAFSWSGLDLMAKNLTRFLAWQNPLALPLACVGVAALRRLDGPLAAMAAGLVLTVIAMFVLLPLQGFGWGYRYLHGFLGSFCLLAAWGWVVVTRDRTGEPRALAQLGVATLFVAAAVMPSRATEVEAVVLPYAAAEHAIEVAKTDLVIVDSNGTAFATALVRNDPFLRNRPLVLDLASLEPAQVARLCAAHSVSLFDQADGDAFHLFMADKTPDSPTRIEMRKLGCGHPLRTKAPD